MMEKTFKRSFHVDWLRVLAVLALFPFHAGQLFNDAVFYVKDQVSSPVIMLICGFIYQWHMPLFMFLAGMSSCYALRCRSGKTFLRARFKRLLVPLIFGTLVIVPPAAYLRMFGDPDRVWHQGFSHNAIPGFDKSYLAYYPDFFNGIYPNGNFEWGHLWFLAYLFTFSLLALPVFLYLNSKKGRSVIAVLKKGVANSFGIFLFFIPIALIELFLRRAYPNMQNLISDWANFLMLITVFVFGFMMAADQAFEDAIDKRWKGALAGGGLIALSLSAFHVLEVQTGLSQDQIYPVAMVLRGIGIWSCLVGFLGLAKRFMSRGGRLINYLSEAALPVYLLHLPVIVISGFYIIRFEIPIAVKYVSIVILSLIASCVLFEIAVKPFRVVRFFFGLKNQAQGDPGAAGVLHRPV